MEQKMGTLIVTYSVAWVAIGAYAVWFKVGDRRLRRQLNRLYVRLNAAGQGTTRFDQAA
jgi:hypothetical protein